MNQTRQKAKQTKQTKKQTQTPEQDRTTDSQHLRGHPSISHSNRWRNQRGYESWPRHRKLVAGRT